jgi:hypothetical protein
VTSSPEYVVVERIAASTAGARQVLRCYMDEVVSRYYRRQATEEETTEPGIMRNLHELLWYLTEVLTLQPARPLHGELGIRGV